MSATFVCSLCHKTFVKARSDEEARAEQERLFPGFEPEDCDLVCDDCFKRMGFKEPA